MATQQKLWDADWQPYDDDEDPFKADWEPTDRGGTENPWEAEWQEEVKEAPTFGGRVKESWEIGKKQVSIGQLGFKQVLGDASPETEARAQAIEETIPSGPRPSRALPEQAVRAAAEMAPIPLTGMEQGLRRGTALGLGFGAIATLGGPAAPITVPAAAAAGFSIGMISASLENIGGIEAGLAYREFKDLKDPDTGEKMNEAIAKVAGLGVGAINGAIELLQIKTFLRSIPGAESLVRKGLTASVKKVLQSKALKSIVFRAAKKYGTGVAIETGQEELQEIVNISGRYMATEVNNALKGTKIPTQTRKEIVDQLWETGKQSALAFSVFMAPGTAVSSTQDMAERRKKSGPGEADLLKTETKTQKQETDLREAYSTGKINSTHLKEIQSQFPKKHPTYKVIDSLLKESEATIPEKDMMTGDVLALEPEDFLPDEAIPESQMFEAAPPQEPEWPGSPAFGIPARESAQVFEEDIARQKQAQTAQAEEARRVEAERVTRETYDRTARPGYEGLTQQVKEKGEASEIEGMEFKVPYIRGLLEQVKGAEAGHRIRVTDYDGTEKWFGVPSEFPAFMKNRYSKKEVVRAIEKGLSGYVFPEHEVKQASIWEDVKSEAYEMRNRDLRLAAETYIEEPTTIKGLPDKDYKLLITELQHEGISTREIEEIAARHRKQIEGDVIASIGNEYGFSKEEIEEILNDPFEAASDRDAAWKEATGTKPVAAYLTPVTEAEGYAETQERRLARTERKGKEPGRAILEREAGTKETEAGGVLQEASPDEIEQKGHLIAKLINGNLFPGHGVKYDGIWPGFAPDMPDMYQFTCYAKESPAFKATFLAKELEADAVKDKLELTVEKFSKAAPEKEFKEAIDLAAEEAETEPTEAQKEAGNYQKGHINLYGLDITIENPKGSIRKGKDKDGKAWEIVVKHHYGYILRTEDKDGDQVDVFVGDELTSDKVFVVNQMVPATTQFDEHKTMMGFETVQKARVAYLANYESGWQGLGNIVALSVDEFKAWLKYGDQTKPISKADIKGHDLDFMTEHKTKAELDKIYQGQVKQLTERAGPDKTERAKMLAEVISAYKIEVKKYTEKEVVEKAPEEFERRKDIEERTRVEQMTPEEMRKELLSDHLTGLGNKRAYEEDERLPVQVFIDADSLKWVNDNISHEAGDVLLRVIGDALKQTTAYVAYHISGDEFIIQAKSEEEAHKLLDAADEYLAGKEFVYELPDGRIIKKKGVGISYGIAQNITVAEQHLKEHKAERERKGFRAPRGETPPGVVTVPSPRRETEREVKEKPIREPESLKEVFESPSATEKEVIREKAHLKEKAEPLALTPEKGTLWERQAELEKEGAVERPAKGKKVQAKFGKPPVTGAGAVGRQQGLFGYEKGETSDMFAEAEEKAAKKEAKAFVNTLDQVRADAKKGKKAGIDYTAQMEVAETGDIVEVTTDAGTSLNEADNRLENYNKLLECIESD